MIRTPSALGAALLLAAATLAQPPAAAPDPELDKWLARLDDALADKRMQRDADAVLVLQQLAAAYERGLDAPSRRKVANAAASALTKGKLRTPDAPLYPAAATALSRMGGDGAKALQRAYEAKRFPGKPEWAGVRAQLVLNLGRTRDPGAVEFLCERASRDRDDEVMAAAGETLGNYAEANQGVRKTIAKELITKLGEVETTANRPTANPAQPSLESETASRTLRAIRTKWMTSIARLTGQRFDDGTEAQRWWNKNKERDWDKAAAGGK